MKITEAIVFLILSKCYVTLFNYVHIFLFSEVLLECFREEPYLICSKKAYIFTQILSTYYLPIRT